MRINISFGIFSFQEKERIKKLEFLRDVVAVVIVVAISAKLCVWVFGKSVVAKLLQCAVRRNETHLNSIECGKNTQSQHQ